MRENFKRKEINLNNSQLNDYMLEQVMKILEGVAIMYDVEVTVEEVGSAQGACSDISFAEVIGDIADRLACYKKVHTLYDRFSGCEDFTYMMNAIQDKGGQASYILLGTSLTAPHHNGLFDFKEADMLNGVLLLGSVAYELGK